MRHTVHPRKTIICIYSTCICITSILLLAELDSSFLSLRRLLSTSLPFSLCPAPSNLECANGVKLYSNTTLAP